MTRKLRYLCTLLLMAVASVAWAEDVVFYTLDTSEKQGTGQQNSYGASYDIDYDDITWNFNGNIQMNPWRLGGKKISGVDRTVYTKTAMGAAITKIDLTLSNGVDITLNSLKLTVASNDDFSTVLDEVTLSSVTLDGVNTVTPSPGKTWAKDAYYKFTFNVTVSGDKNKYIGFDKVEFYKEQEAGEKIDPTVTIGSESIEIGGTTEVTSDGPAVTLTTEDETVSINGTTITGVAEGEATVVATWEGNDQFNEGSATFVVTVIDPNAPGTKNNPYTVAQAIAFINELGENVLSEDEVYVKGIVSKVDKLNYNKIVYWISDDGTTTVQMQVYNGLGLNGADFTAVTDLTVGDQVTVCGKVKLYKNNSGTIPEFDTGSKIVEIVKNTKVDPELAFDKTSIDVEKGVEFTEPTLTNPHNLTVTYSSDKETVATVASDGKLTIVGAGTARITASFAGNDEYNAGTASYLVKVTDPNVLGGKNNPYTVAQALAAIDDNTGVTGVYVQGIVSEIVTAYNSQYGNISYNISVDGSTTADQLLAYRGKSYNGDNFTSSDDIRVDDIVVVYGNLTKYNDTYELAADNQLYKLERPVSQETRIVASDVTLEYDATSGEIEYTIENPQTGVSINAELDESCDWISDIQVGETITFTTTANEGEADRSATITLSYSGAEDKVVTITQTYKMIAVEADDSKTTFYFTNNKWGIPTSKAVEEALFTADGYTIKLKGSSGNGYSYYPQNYLMLGKQDAYLTLPAFSFPVNKIEVVGRDGASTAVTQNIFVGNNAVSTQTAGATGTNTYEIASDYQEAGTIYTLKVTSNANTQITQIIVYKGEESGTISTGINNVEQTIGDAAIYNLNGVRVNKVQKGVYVVNGKKVVIK